MNVSKYIHSIPFGREEVGIISPNRRGFLIGSLSCFALASCGSAKSKPEGLVPGEQAVVSRVRDGDTIILDTGLVVRLVGIEAPRRAWKDRKADPFGEEAAELLMLVALGRKCQLFYGGLTRDRYDRALAYVRVEDEAGKDIWLNTRMVELGGARVRTWADNAVGVRELYALETAARNQDMGLWQHAEYDVVSPDGFKNSPRGLVILQGKLSKISEVIEPESRCYVNNNSGIELSLGLPLARSNERFDLQVGQEIRLRAGLKREKTSTDKYDGTPFLQLDHWGQIETII